MARIRVKIIRHDGISKREALWTCIAKAEAFVYKTITTQDSFVLITDSEQMDKLLTVESKYNFTQEGLEITNPPEYTTARSVLVRGIDIHIKEMSEVDIINDICQNYPECPVVRAIRIPNNPKLMKIICGSSKTANEIIQKGTLSC